MRIAFILLCHKNPEQINMLIGKLSEFSGADIFIHVDRKHSDIRESIIKRENTYLSPEDQSFIIQWGGINIVKATLQLIRNVRNSGKRYDYIWLVSGQDFPICPVSEIERRLSARQGMNYIETILPGDQRYRRYKKLYEMAYLAWINKNTLIVKAVKRIYMIITGGKQYTFFPFVRKKPFDFDFVFGSQWWTLTAEAAYEILAYSDQHPELLEYYQKSIIPDECFFQTLFMRGSYREKRAMNLTYINWKKNRRSPEVLTLDDKKTMTDASNQFCFARKFELPQSAPLLEWMDDGHAVKSHEKGIFLY